MDTTTLGKTGLKVSVMGVGGGGPSQLGRRAGKPDAESIAIIRQAFDAGVNNIDTSENYGTEEIVGKAIEGIDRDTIVISTKKRSKRPITPQDVHESVETSLKRLGTDYIDIYSLHGVLPEDYDYLRSEILPTFLRLREQGKIRFIGISEMFNQDMAHSVLKRALQDDLFDVMMVGFNILNQTARDAVLAESIQKNIGIQVMFAVRAALSKPEKLVEVVAGLIQKGQLDPADIDPDNPLGFLIAEGHAKSLVDAAYRFCRHEPGTHAILSGTGNPDHLKANIESLSRPPLPEDVVDRLKQIFRRVDSVTGQ